MFSDTVAGMCADMCADVGADMRADMCTVATRRPWTRSGAAVPSSRCQAAQWQAAERASSLFPGACRRRTPRPQIDARGCYKGLNGRSRHQPPRVGMRDEKQKSAALGARRQRPARGAAVAADSEDGRRVIPTPALSLNRVVSLPCRRRCRAAAVPHRWWQCFGRVACCRCPAPLLQRVGLAIIHVTCNFG